MKPHPTKDCNSEMLSRFRNVSEQTFFSAELNPAQARLHELLSGVQLYRAFGGGWPPGNEVVPQ